jgi:curli biogenesis system outer membrane secretion channel CsgG
MVCLKGFFMKFYHPILILFVAIFTSGCISSSVNLLDYTQTISPKMELNNECKVYYNKEKPSVAVVNFTNNSNFGVADENNKNEDASAGVGVSIIGVGIGAKSSSSKTSRVVDPKLASSFIPQIEQMLLETGGVELFTRSDYDKVDSELKLQDSGLLDPQSVVEFGLTSGVKYLVTGSIDYVEHNHKEYSKYTGALVQASRYSTDDNFKIATVALDLATGLFDGTLIKTAATVKILDVATGKIIFTKQIQNETKLNSKKAPTYSQLVGALKNNIAQALPSIQEHFTQQFVPDGYITKIKHSEDEEDMIVQINMGSDENIMAGDILKVNTIETTTDPLTNQVTCEKIPLGIELEATQHISPTHTWTKVIDGDVKNIKLLQLVEKE